MRNELAKDTTLRKRFSGIFARTGKKVDFKGNSQDTILLKSVIDLDTNKAVTDHLWFAYSKGFEKAALKPGDSLEFEARIVEYEKGYVNNQFKIDNRESDYKLSYPTKIKKIPSREN